MANPSAAFLQPAQSLTVCTLRLAVKSADRRRAKHEARRCVPDVAARWGAGDGGTADHPAAEPRNRRGGLVHPGRDVDGVPPQATRTGSVRGDLPARRPRCLRGLGFGLAVATSLASAIVYYYFHIVDSPTLIPDEPADFVSLLVFLPVALSANILGRQARLRAVESEQRRREAEAAASLASALAEQQAALRRVATMVAQGVPPAEIYPAAVTELSRGLGVRNVTLLRYEAPAGRMSSWAPATSTATRFCQGAIPFAGGRQRRRTDPP